jgi:sulfur-oxidizing protein SoxZ
MTNSIKLRAYASGDIVTIKALISHPMESGLRKDENTGQIIPAYFIEEVTAEHGGSIVFRAHWGGGVSRNPYLFFKIKGAKVGDSITLTWIDNKGESDSLRARIK